MRAAALALAAAALAACKAEAPELVVAYCKDGTRFVGQRSRVETSCLRRRGIMQIAPFDPAKDEPSPDK